MTTLPPKSNLTNDDRKAGIALLKDGIVILKAEIQRQEELIEQQTLWVARNITERPEGYATLDDYKEMVLVLRLLYLGVRYKWRDDIAEYQICYGTNDLDAMRHELKSKERALLLLAGGSRANRIRDWETKKAMARAVPITSLMEFRRSNFAKCIWHTERSASLKYYPQTNSVHCFGCQKSGDAIDVARTLHGLSFREAVDRLCTS